MLALCRGRGRLLLPLTSLPLFHRNRCLSAVAHLLRKPLSFLRKYRRRTEEMNFIAPFSFPLFIDRGSTPAFCDFCSYYLKRGREDEFYSLCLCCSPPRAAGPPSTLPSSATLPLLLLNTDLKGILPSEAFVPVLRTVL